MTYDSEDLLDSVLQIMTDGLNTKIAAIEAEKVANGKGLTGGLKAIDSAAYFVQSWTDKILNKTPAIFYGVEDVQATDGGGAVAKNYKLFVEVILVDNGQTNDAWKRVARYSRALEEIFKTAFAPAIEGSHVKVEQVRPMAFKLELDSSDEIKVGGVSLSVTIV